MNDLIGLKYCWGARPSDGSGKTDCFQLVCEIRSRLGLSDYTESFAWAYWLYSPETLKPIHVARWLLKSGKRIKMPTDGAVALIARSKRPALGSVVDDRLIFIAPGESVVSLPLDRVKAYYFWVD